jgi:four helix bundle protein
MDKRIEKFEELIAWQKARILTCEIYHVTAIGRFASDFGLKNQIQRAAVSIMSNLAEGFERGRPAEFHQFLSMAKASCAELRSQLYVALDAEYLEQSQFDHLMTLAQEVALVIGGLRAAVERRRDAQKAQLSPQSSVRSTS